MKDEVQEDSRMPQADDVCENQVDQAREAQKLLLGFPSNHSNGQGALNSIHSPDMTACGYC